MNYLFKSNDRYQTVPAKVSLFSKLFPEVTFYSRFLMIVFKAAGMTRNNIFDREALSSSSFFVVRALEKIGVCFDISGIKHIERLDRPCVIVANHMSVLETAILPVIIQPYKNLTFIVKDSLMRYPVFNAILATLDPIVVSRTNPRQDLKTVINQGGDRLGHGMSVVVFPQTTRSQSFDAHKFNSLGIKLARRANVPVLPLALATDAWGNGKFVKDFGKIDAARKVRFHFGQPISVEGRGVKAHQAVIDFIKGKLSQWQYPAIA